MTKSLWHNGIHLDLSDEATEADIVNVKAFADKLVKEQQRRKDVFNRAWAAVSATGDKDVAWKWFDLGCGWQSQRQAQ